MKSFIKKNLFEIIFIPVMLASLTTSAVFFHSEPLILILTILGMFGSVLNGRGNKLCYFFGLTSTVMYGIVSLKANFIGEVILHFAFLSPMYIYSIAKWFRPNNKKQAKNKQMFSLNAMQIIFLIIVGLIIVGVYGTILKFVIKSSFPFLNAVSTVVVLLAGYLGAKRVKEQWIAHILGNAVLIALWFLSGDKGNYPILIQNALFVVCNVRGIIIWQKELRKQNPKPIEPNDY